MFTKALPYRASLSILWAMHTREPYLYSPSLFDTGHCSVCLYRPDARQTLPLIIGVTSQSFSSSSTIFLHKTNYYISSQTCLFLLKTRLFPFHTFAGTSRNSKLLVWMLELGKLINKIWLASYVCKANLLVANLLVFTAVVMTLLPHFMWSSDLTTLMHLIHAFFTSHMAALWLFKWLHINYYTTCNFYAISCLPSIIIIIYLICQRKLSGTKGTTYTRVLLEGIIHNTNTFQ